jgi:hypothetical protein
MKRLGVDDSYFSVLDNTRCYWAGFLAADGYVAIDRPRLRLNLALKDRDHLDKFVGALNYEGKIRTYTICLNEKKHEYVCLQISSYYIVTDLREKFNIVNNKSLILSPPTDLREIAFIKSFIAGYIDGDGSIDLSHPFKKIRLRIYGTSPFLWFIKDYFDQWYRSYNGRISTVKPMGNIYNYTIIGKRTKAIAKDFLKLGVPLLRRKWSRALG